MKSWVLAVGAPVEAAVVAALWKLRTSKTDTYTRLRATVGLGLAALDRSSVEALVKVRSKLPVTGFDRSMGAEDFEDVVKEYSTALREKRRLQRRFRRLLASTTLLIIGLGLTVPSGTYLLLRGAGIKEVTAKFVPAGWVMLGMGIVLASVGLAGQLIYEAKIAKVAIATEARTGDELDD